MESTAKLPVIGLDIAKNVFQLHVVDVETGEIQRRQLKRGKVAEFFANRQPSLVALEACGGAHHWARTLLAMGHQVKLLPARHVKAFLLRETRPTKTNALDAQAIWVAATTPGTSTTGCCSASRARWPRPNCISCDSASWAAS